MIDVISHDIIFENEAQIITELFDAGMSTFHLRKPDSKIEEMVSFMNLIPEKYHSKIVLHRYFEIFNKYNFKGFHFNKSNINLLDCIDLSGKQVGYSAHNFEEILKINHRINYVFLSPVFDSISKEGYKSSFHETELKAFLKNKNISTKVIGLGGINDENIQKAYSLGFDNVAVKGYFWSDLSNVKEIVNKYKKLKDRI